MPGSQLLVEKTAIPGLFVLDLPVHGDNRGWFKENWQREKMVALGLPDFAPVQHSVAYNEAAGVTRGIHAEPWDKLVSIAHGQAFCAWVDLRPGPSQGVVHTEMLDPGKAVFVPRGVGNSYQTQVPGTVYSYLVNQHWSPDVAYTLLNLADETVAIDWPIPLSEAEISTKDENHPRLADIKPIPPLRTLVIGARGQVGQALQAELPHADAVARDELDLADAAAVQAFDFSGYDVVINAAAFTQVDGAETETGRRAAWAANAVGVAALARAAAGARARLVHFSTDYVFDGAADEPWATTDEFAPLSVYGQSKAAGDLAVSVHPQHYILRTSWVIGSGKNFISTMQRLAANGVSPSVVNDQVGRLSFAQDLARAARHLIDVSAPYGTYNVTSAGEPMTWAQIAEAAFVASGREATDVTGISTADYFAGATEPVAPRPKWSVLDLSAIEATGFETTDQRASLARYLRGSVG